MPGSRTVQNTRSRVDRWEAVGGRKEWRGWLHERDGISSRGGGGNTLEPARGGGSTAWRLFPLPQSLMATYEWLLHTSHFHICVYTPRAL